MKTIKKDRNISTELVNGKIAFVATVQLSIAILLHILEIFSISVPSNVNSFINLGVFALLILLCKFPCLDKLITKTEIKDVSAIAAFISVFYFVITDCLKETVSSLDNTPALTSKFLDLFFSIGCLFVLFFAAILRHRVRK